MVCWAMASLDRLTNELAKEKAKKAIRQHQPQSTSSAPQIVSAVAVSAPRSAPTAQRARPAAMANMPCLGSQRLSALACLNTASGRSTADNGDFRRKWRLDMFSRAVHQQPDGCGLVVQLHHRSVVAQREREWEAPAGGGRRGLEQRGSKHCDSPPV